MKSLAFYENIQFMGYLQFILEFLLQNARDQTAVPAAHLPAKHLQAIRTATEEGIGDGDLARSGKSLESRSVSNQNT